MKIEFLIPEEIAAFVKDVDNDIENIKKRINDILCEDFMDDNHRIIELESILMVLNGIRDSPEDNIFIPSANSCSQNRT